MLFIVVTELTSQPEMSASFEKVVKKNISNMFVTELTSHADRFPLTLAL